MNIKCPNCQTAYTVPSEKIGDKPKRMRCARCKEVFTVKRRSERTPYGYEEFTGKQQALPPELAFLKTSIPPPAPQAESEPAPTASPDETGAPLSRVAASPKESATPAKQPPPVPAFPPQAGPPPVPTGAKHQTQPKEGSAKEPGFDYEDFDTGGEQDQPFSDQDFTRHGSDGETPSERPSGGPEGEENRAQTPAVSALPISIISMDPADVASIPAETTEMEFQGIEPSAPGEAASKIEAPSPHQTPAAPVPQKSPPAAGDAAAARATSPSVNGIGDIYSSSSWETEAPLDLAGFAVSIPPEPAKSQKIGKIVGISTGVFFLLLLFVMIRNDWSLSLAEFPSQVAFAFSGGTLEKLPDAVKELEATVDGDRRIVRRAGKGALLVVKGLVFNNDVIPHSHVVLRGRLIDGAGDIRAELRFACDRFFDDRVLQDVADGQVPALYKKGGEMHNCMIAKDSQSSYWLVFERIPADYDGSFNVEVTPIFAK